MMPLMLTSVSSTVATSFEENESGNTPEGIWSEDYANHVHPWGGDDRVQFKQYHDYDSMRQRMLQLAEQSYSYQGQDVEIMFTLCKQYVGFNLSFNCQYFEICSTLC